MPRAYANGRPYIRPGERVRERQSERHLHLKNTTQPNTKLDAEHANSQDTHLDRVLTRSRTCRHAGSAASPKIPPGAVAAASTGLPAACRRKPAPETDGGGAFVLRCPKEVSSSRVSSRRPRTSFTCTGRGRRVGLQSSSASGGCTQSERGRIFLHTERNWHKDFLDPSVGSQSSMRGGQLSVNLPDPPVLVSSLFPRWCVSSFDADHCSRKHSVIRRWAAASPMGEFTHAKKNSTLAKRAARRVSSLSTAGKSLPAS